MIVTVQTMSAFDLATTEADARLRDMLRQPEPVPVPSPTSGIGLECHAGGLCWRPAARVVAGARRFGKAAAYRDVRRWR